MQKKALFNPRQTLVLAYLLAVVLWLVRCLAGSAVMLNYKMQGKMPQVTLAPDELTTESFAAYSSNEWWTAPDDDPNWYLSTDSDPHIYWQGQGYIETVELDAAHRLPRVAWRCTISACSMTISPSTTSGRSACRAGWGWCWRRL